jgi:predicted NBD/HSP70 family sugar kinase
MAHGIGIIITERISVAAVRDHELVGTLRSDPDDSSITDTLQGVPADTIIERMVDLSRQLKLSDPPEYVGLGMPGIVRGGIVEDSPNLVQFKGLNMQQLVGEAFNSLFGRVPVSVGNDADVLAAGLAASRGHLDRIIRVWTLGTGIGFGRYPVQDGVWEAGHTVVTLDPKEQFCGCGGKGHLEGIMGHRAMRLRFMDLEPDEVFAEAEAGETRCVEFVKLWHRALAAATASSVHISGPGRFYITGPNSEFVNLTLVGEYLHEMVKLSPLQSYSLEIVQGEEALAAIGAAVNAAQALEQSAVKT